MRTHELIDDLCVIGLRYSDLEVMAQCFMYLAGRVPEARLAGDVRLVDASDFRVWLRELAEAAREKKAA